MEGALVDVDDALTGRDDASQLQCEGPPFWIIALGSASLVYLISCPQLHIVGLVELAQCLPRDIHSICVLEDVTALLEGEGSPILKQFR